MAEASLNVVINAVDNASGVIAGVAAELSGLSGAGAAATAGVGSVNGAFSGTAAAGRAANAAYTAAALGGTALNNSTVTAASGVAALEQKLQTQKNTTMQYAREVRNAKNDLRAKQAVLESTAKTYKATTAPIKENISSLKTQQSSLKETITARQNEISSLTDTNKGLKKSSQAYKENQKAIQWVRTELGDTQEKYRKVGNEISAQEAALKGHTATYKEAQANVKAAAQSHEELRAKMKDSAAAEKEIAFAVREGDVAARGSIQTQKTLRTALTAEYYQKSGKIIKEYGEGVDTLTKPLQTAAVAAIGLGAASTVAAVKFEDNFANVKKTVEGTPEQLEAVRKGIIDMTTVGINGHGSIPQTTAELTELAAAGGQLGIQTENILDFTETMAMLGSATNLQGEAGAQTLARFMNVADVSQKDIKNLGSAVVDLGNNFATTEAEIANMAMDMGATGATVGMSAQDILGYATAMSSMGIDAAAGGSALQRIWMEMQNAVSNGGDELQAFSEVSGKSSEEFQKQWKEDATGAFNDFLKGLNKSDDQVGLLTALGFNNVRDQRALLALAGGKGFDILTEAIERSNKAWEENAALQTEFENKQQTAASQIQIVKNNAVEAARSFGEVLLPTIVDVTGGLSGAAQGLASLDDRSKKTLVATGAVVVGLGAVSKGTVGVIKGIGNTADALGKIKKASEAGGILENIATALPTVAGAAVPVALGIVGITTAVVAGKAAYEAWYNSQYRWTNGLSDGNAKIKESLDNFKNLSKVQQEIKDAKLIIENPESSKEQVQQAKNKIEEIKSLLEEEYDLKIKSDNSNLESTVETLKNISELETLQNINSQSDRLQQLKPKFDEYQSQKSNLEADLKSALEAQERYGELKLKISELDKSSKDYLSDLVELGKQYGMENIGDPSEVIARAAVGYDNASKSVKDYSDQLKNLKGSYDEYIAISTEIANWQTELINASALEGNDDKVQNYLSKLGETVRRAGLDMNGYAQAAAQAINGIDFKTAWQKGGETLDKFSNDYVRAMRAFGATTEDTVAGLALIKSGFSNVSEVSAEAIPKVIANLRELGNTQGLEMSAEKLTEIARAMGLIPDNKKIVINADGNISIIDEAKKKTEELPAEHNTDITVTDKTSEGVSAAEENLNNLPTEKTITIKTVLGSTVGFSPDNTPWAQKKADGTQNFSGGLAWLNDDGRADPRELVIDRGRAFIPEGRDVILPLSKGAKVYTSAQTKAIMSGLGIPHYAEGKDNSDAFVNARNDWSHYTKTHSVATTQELEKWLEFRRQYKENEKDIADIDEQIFSLTKKISDEQNKQSSAWIADRVALNNWKDYGDSAIEAFDRVKARNKQDLDAGRLTLQEYTDIMSKLGSDMYSGRINQSKQWLERERNYNDLSTDGYLAGIDRMRAYTEEYYAKGLINHREYVEGKIALDEMEADKKREQYAEWKTDADAWETMRDTYSDWEDVGDNKEDFLIRKIDRAKEAFAAGKSDLKTFTADMNEYKMNLFKYRGEMYDDFLSQRRDYISDMKEEFSAAEKALQDSWTTADRKEDIGKVSAQLDIYSDAVTDRGQQKYRELQEQMKKLQREEELYQLQVRNNATIEALEDEYKQLEAGKSVFLRGIKDNFDIDVSGLLRGFEQSNNTINRTLGEIIDAIHNIKMEQTNYTDSRTIQNFISHLSSEQKDELLNTLGR